MDHHSNNCVCSKCAKKPLHPVFTNPLSRKKRTLRKQVTIRRNGPCPCGSGKKYKKCCKM